MSERLHRLSGATLLASLLCVAGGFAQISIKVNQIVQVDGTGTETQNCQALRDTLASLSGVSASNRYLVRLEPGGYDCGTLAVFVPVGATLEGSGPEQTTIHGMVDNTSLGVVHLVNDAVLRSLTVDNRNSNATFGAIAVSVFDLGGTSNGVTLEHVVLKANFLGSPGDGVGLKTVTANVFVSHSEIFSTVDLDGGATILRYTIVPTVSPFAGTGTKGCAYCADFIQRELGANCLLP